MTTNIQTLRREFGYTQEYLAKQIGVSRPTYIQIEKKAVTVVKYWLDSPQRRQYDGIAFSPQGDTPNHYNLWQGFSVKPLVGDWSLMEDHIEEIGKDRHRIIALRTLIDIQLPFDFIVG